MVTWTVAVAEALRPSQADAVASAVSDALESDQLDAIAVAVAEALRPSQADAVANAVSDALASDQLDAIAAGVADALRPAQAEAIAAAVAEAVKSSRPAVPPATPDAGRSARPVPRRVPQYGRALDPRQPASRGELLARGIPIWILATFAHFVLGVPAYLAAIGAATASAATARGVHRR